MRNVLACACDSDCSLNDSEQRGEARLIWKAHEISRDICTTYPSTLWLCICRAAFCQPVLVMCIDPSRKKDAVPLLLPQRTSTCSSCFFAVLKDNWGPTNQGKSISADQQEHRQCAHKQAMVLGLPCNSCSCKYRVQTANVTLRALRFSMMPPPYRLYCNTSMSLVHGKSSIDDGVVTTTCSANTLVSFVRIQSSGE